MPGPLNVHGLPMCPSGSSRRGNVTDDEVAQETLAAFGEHEIDVVLLAGYLRRIPTEITRRYAGRMLNIHPALLPHFGGPGMYGMNVHRAVAESGTTVTGATVHFVSEDV